MSSKKFPSIVKLRKLVNILRTAPKPILIHCKAGADRTGLASAIVLILHDYSIQKVTYQYSYHDLALSFNSAGKLVIPYYLCWLKRHHLKRLRKSGQAPCQRAHPTDNGVLPQHAPMPCQYQNRMFQSSARGKGGLTFIHHRCATDSLLVTGPQGILNGVFSGAWEAVYQWHRETG